MQSLRDAVEKKNMNRGDLCRGLCSASVFTKYLNGERKEEVPEEKDVRKWREDFWNRPFSSEDIILFGI